MSEFEDLRKIICSSKQCSITQLKQFKTIIEEGKFKSLVVKHLQKLISGILKYAFNQSPNYRDIAIPIFIEFANLLDLNKHIKDDLWWKGTKNSILESIDTLTQMVPEDSKWSDLWCAVVLLLGTDLKGELTLLNKLLKVVEKAFKINVEDTRNKGFHCWRKLIDNFAINRKDINDNRKRLILLVIPLKANNHSTNTLCAAKMLTWIHLLSKLDKHNKTIVQEVIYHFLQFMFIGINNLSPACKILSKDCADVFLQLIKTPEVFTVLPEMFINHSFICIEHIYEDSTKSLKIWDSVMECIRQMQWPETHLTTLLKGLNKINRSEPFVKSRTYSSMLHSLYSGNNALPASFLSKNYNSIIFMVLTPDVLVNFTENWCNELFDQFANTEPLLLPQNIIQDIISSLNDLSTNKMFRDDALKLLRSIWVTLINLLCKWMSDGCQMSESGTLQAAIQNTHRLLLFGAARLSTMWNKFQMKSWKHMYCESVKYFSIQQDVKADEFLSDLIGLLLKELQDTQIPLHVTVDIVVIILEFNLSKDVSTILPLMMEVGVIGINSLQNDVSGISALLNNYLKSIVMAARSEPNIVNALLTVTDKMSRDLESYPTSTFDKIRNMVLKAQHQLQSLKPCRVQEKSESPCNQPTQPASSPTVTSFLHRLAKAKETKAKMASPTSSQCSEQSSSPSHTPNSKKISASLSDLKPDDFVFVPPKTRKTILTDHQKESLTTRKHDIPALYQDLSQDSSQSALESIVTSVQSNEDAVENFKRTSPRKQHNTFELHLKGAAPKKISDMKIKTDNESIPLNNKENDCVNNNNSPPTASYNLQAKCFSKDDTTPIKHVQQDKNLNENTDCTKLLENKDNFEPKTLRSRKSLMSCVNDELECNTPCNNLGCNLSSKDVHSLSTNNINNESLNESLSPITNFTNELNTPKRRMKRGKLVISRSKRKSDSKFQDNKGSNHEEKSNNKTSPPKTSPRRLRKRKSGITPILSGGKELSKKKLQLSLSPSNNINSTVKIHNSPEKYSTSEENVENLDVSNKLTCNKKLPECSDAKAEKETSLLQDNNAEITKLVSEKMQVDNKISSPVKIVLSRLPVNAKPKFRKNFNALEDADNFAKSPVEDSIENKSIFNKNCHKIEKSEPSNKHTNDSNETQFDNKPIKTDSLSTSIEYDQINEKLHTEKRSVETKKANSINQNLYCNVNISSTEDSNVSNDNNSMQVTNEARTRDKVVNDKNIGINSNSTNNISEHTDNSKKTQDFADKNKSSVDTDSVLTESKTDKCIEILTDTNQSFTAYESSENKMDCTKEIKQKSNNFSSTSRENDTKNARVNGQLKKGKDSSDKISQESSITITESSMFNTTPKNSEILTKKDNDSSSRVTRSSKSIKKTEDNSQISNGLSILKTTNYIQELSSNKHQEITPGKVIVSNHIEVSTPKVVDLKIDDVNIASEKLNRLKENAVSEAIKKSSTLNNKDGENNSKDNENFVSKSHEKSTVLNKATEELRDDDKLDCDLKVIKQSSVLRNNTIVEHDKASEEDCKATKEENNLNNKIKQNDASSLSETQSINNRNKNESAIEKEIKNEGSTPLKSSQKHFKQTQLPFTPIRKPEVPSGESLIKITQSKNENPCNISDTDKQPIILIERLNSNNNINTSVIQDTNLNQPNDIEKSDSRQEVLRTPEKVKSTEKSQVQISIKQVSPGKNTESEDIIESSQDDNACLQSSLTFSGGQNQSKILRKSPQKFKVSSCNQSLTNNDRVLRSSPVEAKKVKLSGTPVKKSVCRRLDIEIDCKPLEITSVLDGKISRLRPSSPLIIEDEIIETQSTSNTPDNPVALLDDVILLDDDVQTTNSLKPSNWLEQNVITEKSKDDITIINTSPSSHKGSKRLMQDPEMTSVDSPSRSRISLKLEVGSPKSPSSRTNQMVELAMQDKEKTISSPVNTIKKRRINPLRLGSVNKFTDNSPVIIQRRLNGGPSEEWIRHTYSPLASPNGSILKRKCDVTTVSPDSSPPSLKKKRVSFLDPPVSESLLFSKKDPGKGQIQRPEQKQETESEVIESQGSVQLVMNVEELSHSKVYSPLKQCPNPLNDIIERIVSSQWASELESQLERLGVTTIGQLSSLTEATIERLPFLPPKVERLRKILQNYFNEINEKPESRTTEEHVMESEEVISTPADEDQMAIEPTDLVEESSEQQQLGELLPAEEDLSAVADKIKTKIELHPELINELIKQLNLDTIVSIINCAVQKLKNEAEQN